MVQLCDFGLSRVAYEISRTRTIPQSSCTIRYMAPELDPLEPSNFRSNEASDVYALAMTIYSLGTTKHPMEEMGNGAFIAAMRRKERPPFPATLGGMDSGRTIRLMELIGSMWTDINAPKPRPSMTHVCSEIDLLRRVDLS